MFNARSGFNSIPSTRWYTNTSNPPNRIITKVTTRHSQLFA